MANHFLWISQKRVLCAFLAFGLSTPLYATERLALFDQFGGRFINPDKWYGQENSFADPGIGLEASRRVENGHLVISYRGYGERNRNDDARLSQFGLRFQHPDAVTAIKATMKVKGRDFEVVGCPQNPIPMIGEAAITGVWFNTDKPVPNSRINEVIAGIFLLRASNSTDPDNVLRVSGNVIHCRDDICSRANRDTLYTVDLGTVELDQYITLLLQWDPKSHRFIMQRDHGKAHNLPYKLSDTALPSRKVKGIEIDLVGPNCTSTPRPYSNMEIRVDNIYVNTSAVVP